MSIGGSIKTSITNIFSCSCGLNPINSRFEKNTFSISSELLFTNAMSQLFKNFIAKLCLDIFCGGDDLNKLK